MATTPPPAKPRPRDAQESILAGQYGRARMARPGPRDAAERLRRAGLRAQPASSWHTTATGQEAGRSSRTGPESRGVTPGRTARRPSGSPGDAARQGLPLATPSRGSRPTRTTVCRSALHSTPSWCHSKASTRPDSATVSAEKPPRPAARAASFREGMETARAPRVRGAVSPTGPSGPALSLGISRVAGITPQRNEQVTALPGQLVSPHHPQPGRGHGQMFPRVLRERQAWCSCRPRTPLPGDLPCTWRAPLSGS